jgi:hypothetical protein
MFVKLREKLKGWKTIVINALIGVPAAALFFLDKLSAVDITPLIPTQYAAAAVAGMALLGVILRIVTTGPIGSKGNVTPAPDVKAGD